MGGESLNHIVYSKNVVEFVTVANEFCRMVEEVGRYRIAEALGKVQKILPLVYLKAALLPSVERMFEEDVQKFVSELDYNMLLQKWMQLLGEHDSFMEVFEPGIEFNDQPVNLSISESILDIYQVLKNFVVSYSSVNEDIMNDALSDCIISFEQYWGQELVNVLRAVHMLLVSGKGLEETGGNAHSDSRGGDGPHWRDRFFNQ
ncbi:hypothetical protein MNBD_BACTEROID01-375 [hydrothermal vent metagenome]|uniref:DUF5063 domain-containing protein n=1 Tax=hydrothermal vent metagenome TaxID=652676 RepID=A0A3B0U720_9ZZZZ